MRQNKIKIKKNNNLICKINNVIIERVNTIKYLSLIIDKKLKFNGHIDFFCKEIGEKSDFSNA